jgi:hypothetical protein
MWKGDIDDGCLMRRDEDGMERGAGGGQGGVVGSVGGERVERLEEAGE